MGFNWFGLGRTRPTHSYEFSQLIGLKIMSLFNKKDI